MAIIKKLNPELLFAVRKFDITPEYPTSLLGYFNQRISKGVLDPLYCRIAAFKKGAEKLLFIQLDSCLIDTEDAFRLKKKIGENTEYKPHQTVIFTSHTHTAPALADFFSTQKEHGYCTYLFDRILHEVSKLIPDKACSVRAASLSYKNLSYNRRWFLKDGRVVTNPPKGSSLLDKPEGTVDREMITLAFYKNDISNHSRILTPDMIFTSLSNHTDTVGGSMISADWPGLMERHINEMLGGDIPVFPLIAPQGNINHFDFYLKKSQTGYSETRRIGEAYAKMVVKSINRGKPVVIEKLQGIQRVISVPPREVSENNLKKAQEILQTTHLKESKKDLKAEELANLKFYKWHGKRGRESTKDLTAEHLARDDPAIERLFAEELLNFTRTKPPHYHVPLQLIRLGPIVICAIPGEPFAEIGLHLKQLGRDLLIIPLALANGYFGYLPLEECFERGGYEVKPSPYNCLSRKAAELILREFKNMLCIHNTSARNIFLP